MKIEDATKMRLAVECGALARGLEEAKLKIGADRSRVPAAQGAELGVILDHVDVEVGVECAQARCSDEYGRQQRVLVAKALALETDVGWEFARIEVRKAHGGHGDRQPDHNSAQVD
eukprot:scaffold15228_cov118-Isochrysis_galbana.AAC.6